MKTFSGHADRPSFTTDGWPVFNVMYRDHVYTVASPKDWQYAIEDVARREGIVASTARIVLSLAIQAENDGSTYDFTADELDPSGTSMTLASWAKRFDLFL